MRTRVFRAMGTTVELHVEADHAERAFDAAEAEFERLEQVMSRFRPDSELSRLNDAGTLAVSSDLAEVVTLAVEARERTGGSFDPTVHDAVVGAGYDRTFEALPPDRDRDPKPAPCLGGVEVTGRRVSIESGFRLDLGGIGKGYAAERVAELLALTGPSLVSAGGDVAVRGVPAEGSWAVAVDESLTLGLERGGLATSGTGGRRWRLGGASQHHLIDPRTGSPARTDVVRVTAVAGDAVEAEVLAKTLLLGGSAAAVAASVPAVILTEDGRTLTTGGL
ncbi:MAG TPA: FAD:protein FMN transferase [Gaiellaceae bacterium]